jgi:hypothetical protein
MWPPAVAEWAVFVLRIRGLSSSLSKGRLRQLGDRTTEPPPAQPRNVRRIVTPPESNAETARADLLLLRNSSASLGPPGFLPVAAHVTFGRSSASCRRARILRQ